MSLPRLRAPKEHGQILAAPPLDQIDTHFFEPPRKQTRDGLTPIFDAASRSAARAEILEVSRQYHAEAGEAVPDGGFTFVAGHQPELFHPGVWFKNFAIHQLAAKHGGGSLNLIIDTDSAKPAILHAPDGEKLARVPFDHSTAEIPYEERTVDDEHLFAELPARMASITSKWKFEPLLDSYWREVMSAAKRTPLRGERLAAGRRALERRWGMAQREVPMSRVCQTEAFARFALWILGDLPKFHAAYNQVVRDHRRVHHIRSRSHPVPDLAADGEWLEAPFWAWRRGQPRRSRLLVRRNGSICDLRVAGELWPSLPADERSINVWRRLESQGFKVRSRALTTTMFVRLLLADVFVHGIGGALYDELTDAIVERMPPFLVLSATLLLPLPRFPHAEQQARAGKRRLRDLLYKPERFVDAAAAKSLIDGKKEWIARKGVTHAERVERFQHIREVNAALQPFVKEQMQQTHAELAEYQLRAEYDAVAGRRDYAFCLYPEEMLRQFYQTPIV